ncbi:MAG: hypothetical protein ACLP4V_12660 [Methylocella sp.]
MSHSPKSLPTIRPPAVIPRQLSIMFDSVRLRGLGAADRAKAIACLANLLMQAAGVAMEERENDKR